MQTILAETDRPDKLKAAVVQAVDLLARGETVALFRGMVRSIGIPVGAALKAMSD